MLINVSEHPWRSKKEYEEMLYPVDEDLFSVATAEYEADREMDWEDEVAGTVGTLGASGLTEYLFSIILIPNRLVSSILPIISPVSN